MKSMISWNGLETNVTNHTEASALDTELEFEDELNPEYICVIFDKFIIFFNIIHFIHSTK